MARYQYIREDEPPEEEQGQSKHKRKKKLRLDRFERVALVLAAASLATMLVGVKSLHLSRSNHKVERPAGWRILRPPFPRLPETYDPLEELRVPVSEYSAGQRLEEILVILRGPWRFGIAEMERVALALGPATAQGLGYMSYQIEDGSVRLTAIFNIRRLSMLALWPNSCNPAAPDCLHAAAWGLTSGQAQNLRYEPSDDPDDPCGTLEDSTQGFYYDVCRAEKPGEWSVKAVYVERVSRDMLNPVYVRDVLTPDQTQITQRPPLDQEQYESLFQHFRRAVQLSAKTLGADHVWVEYLRFEMGRMQAEAGRRKEGRTMMKTAMDDLERRLGPSHPDVAAMRPWLDAFGKSETGSHRGG